MSIWFKSTNSIFTVTAAVMSNSTSFPELCLSNVFKTNSGTDQINWIFSLHLTKKEKGYGHKVHEQGGQKHKKAKEKEMKLDFFCLHLYNCVNPVEHFLHVAVNTWPALLCTADAPADHSH